ncbi:MAG: glycosyltransferase family 9 protein [Gammaproteobacteria bacterium]
MTSALLVVTLSNIGDVVMTTPVLETLSERYPGWPIDIVADARSVDVLRAAPYTRKIFIRDKRGGPGAQWRLLRALRAQRYELAVDLRTPVIPYLVRARRRLVKYGQSMSAFHAAFEHHAVLRPLIGDASVPFCRLYLEADAMRFAQERLAVLPGGRWLAVAPGANWAGKRWPATGFRELLEHVATDFDGALVLGGSDDADVARNLGGVPLPLLDLTAQTTLPQAAALLARAAAFVGNDSGLGHMAAALGVPTLTVFGPGRPERYRPWGPRTRVVLAPGLELERLQADIVAIELRALISGDLNSCA